MKSIQDLENEVFNMASLIDDDSFSEKFNRKLIRKFDPFSNNPYFKEAPLVAYLIMKDGHTKRVVARKLGISESTLNNWREKHPEFKNALEAGEDHSKGFWEEYAHENKDNPQILKLLLTERCGYSDKSKAIEEEHDHIKFLNHLVKEIKNTEKKSEVL